MDEARGGVYRQQRPRLVNLLVIAGLLWVALVAHPVMSGDDGTSASRVVSTGLTEHSSSAVRGVATLSNDGHAALSEDFLVISCGLALLCMAALAGVVAKALHRIRCVVLQWVRQVLKTAVWTPPYRHRPRFDQEKSSLLRC